MVTMEPALNWIMNRKSERNFIPAEISKETLELIIKAGMAAPSAVNQQMWEFIVVDERKTLDALGEELPYAKMLFQAGAAIITCGNLTRPFDGDPKSLYWIMDCSAATENILLAVEALGLGAVWTAVYPDPRRIASVRSILHLPEHVMPLNVIPIGKPAGPTEPKDKWNPKYVHWNGWGEK
jgi:nitroreductase